MNTGTEAQIEAGDSSASIQRNSDPSQVVEPASSSSPFFASITEVRDELGKNLVAVLANPTLFYYTDSSSTAPNPRAYIVGHGDLELPLKEQDAKAIFDLATHNAADKHSGIGGGKTRHLKYPKFWFENPSWKDFVQFDVVRAVCKALGAETAFGSARCELDQLLITEPDSQFSFEPHEGNFEGLLARIVFLLPSTYEGGKLSLTHDGQTEVVDLAAGPTNEMRTMAWYGNVRQKIEPITSGYLLALTYNLIYVDSTPVPRPMAIGALLTRIRSTLIKWNNTTLPRGEENLISYIFKEKYSIKEKDLSKGLKMLKGRDALLVNRLMPILDELDFACWLVIVTCKIKGPSAGGYYRRKTFDEDDAEMEAGDKDGDWDEDDEDDDDDDHDDSDSEFVSEDGYKDSFGMDRFADIDYEEIKIYSLHELDGTEIVVFNDPIEPADGNLIPPDPFKSTRPDEIKAGEYGYSRKHWYYRPALLILPESSGFGPVFDTAGTSYALTKMRPLGSGPPTRRERIIANGIVDHVRGESAEEIAEYAIEWDDPDLWKRAIMKDTYSYSANLGPDRLVGGWKKWGFDTVRASYEELATSHRQLEPRIEFLKAVPSFAPADEYERVSCWSREQIAHATASNVKS